MPRPRRKPKRKGRFQVPPPALMAGDEGIEGNSILDEVAGAPGLLLWQSLRDVTLWAGTPTPREGLFAPGRERARVQEIAGAEVDAALLGPLTSMGRVLGSASPPEPREITDACRAVSVWADNHGLLKTALSFAQAAAVVRPEDAMAAYRVGWLARRRAEYARAESWFRRAIGLARRSRDRTAYAMAHVGLGGLFMQRREFAAARPLLLTAYRTARRASLRQVQAMALHDLFCISAHNSQVPDAEIYASLAFKAYGRRHNRLTVLAHDVARFWIDQGDFSRAVPVLQAVIPRISHAGERIVAISNLARAAGGTGDLLLFVQTWTEVWKIVGRKMDQEGVSEALVNLAQGAISLNDPERIEMAARYAVESARNRGEQRLQTIAEEILAGIGREGPRPAPARAVRAPNELEAADALAANLVRALRACAGS